MSRWIIAGVLLAANPLWALTGGPAQPEYAGFTPSAKSGSVDLYSGDFSYSLPLMTVPGPSFNYPIVLGYRAGITTDQASTWVGLGWSLNAGSINRSLNKYPDDYLKGRSVNILEGEETVSGWDLGVSYMGVGLSIGQRSDHGWHGGLDFSLAGFDVGGMKFDQSDGFGMREMPTLTDQFVGKASGAALSSLNGQMNSLLGSQEIGLSFSPTAHGMSVSAGGVGFGSSSVSSGAFHNVSNGLSIPVLFTGITIDFSTSSSWLYKKEIEDLYGYLNLQEFPKEINDEDFDTERFKMEYAWAPDMPLVQKNGNSFSSWFFDMISHQKAFVASTPDGYQAKAEGMAMSFRPYRQDIGDYYGQDRMEAAVGFWLNLVNKTWLAYIPAFGEWEDEDRNRYNRELGVNATQFVRQPHSSPEQGPGYANNYKSPTHEYPVTLFRETGTSGGAFLGENWRSKNTGAHCTEYGCELSYRWRTNGIQTGDINDQDGPPNMDGPAAGVQYPDRISGGSGVFPIFKNVYPPASSPAGEGVDPAYCSSANPVIPQCNPAVPIKALIGFTLVRPDGMIYEYHLPVFTWTQKTMSASRPSEDEQGEYDFGAVSNSSSMNRAYATSWLLTAIKGPDYVDIGWNGLDAADIGSWVSFEYGKHVPSFHWRTPYEGVSPLGVGKDDNLKEAEAQGGSNLRFQSYGQASWGNKEAYYLTAIKTPSHSATFVSSPKNDGMEAAATDDASFNGDLDRIQTWSMSPEVGDVLDILVDPGEFIGGICLGTGTQEEVYSRTVTSVTGHPNHEFKKNNGSKTYSAIRLDQELPGPCPEILSVKRTTRAHPDNYQLWKLDEIQLRKNGDPAILNHVKLGYETDVTKQLARGVPDVRTNLSQRPGKLTLRTIVIGDGQSDLPPYRFSYYMEGDEAPYHKHHWDRWGFYKSDGGLVNTEILKGHVLDWDYFLDILRPASTGFAKTTLENALVQELDADDLQAVRTTANAAALREGYKLAIVRAMNRIKNSLTFYSNNPARGTPDLPAPDNLPEMSKKWAGRAVALNLIHNNGGQEKNPADMDQKERNIIHGLQMSILIEKIFKPASDFNLFRDMAINHFDHETNPEDVKAWSLKQIVLPSGGKVDMEFESDDFVYVGRTRAVDLADADKFIAEGNLDYFRNVGAEKSMNSQSNLFRFEEGLLGDLYYKNPDQVKMRVSSLFRVYKKNKSGVWEIMPNFKKLLTKTGPQHKIHLLGMYNAIRVNESVVSGSVCGYSTMSDQGGQLQGSGFLAPFNLGSVVKDFDIRENMPPEWYEANQCQRNYVDFDLSRIALANLEAANRGSAACSNIGNHPSNLHQEFLKDLGYLTLNWARPRDPGDFRDWPLFLPTGAADTRDPDGWGLYERFVDFDPRPGQPPVPANGKNIYPLATDQPFTPYLLSPCSQRQLPAGDNCTVTFQSGTDWIGPGRWDDMTEFSPTDASDSWEVLSFNISRRIAGGDPVSIATGIPGGGLRVKRLSYNSGWPARAGEPPLRQVTEYDYDCSGGNGGVYSSGATPAMPPPYNNKGDDRMPLPPQASLVEGAPFVGYRRVTEIRPGRGKVVYDFLSSADISDYIAYENCNSANIVDGFFLGWQAGCYDKDETIYWEEMRHARWKLHRVSHFQGLMTGKTKYNEAGPSGLPEVVAEEKYKYVTSLLPGELGDLHFTSLLNNSDAVGLGALYSSADEGMALHAGGKNYPFQDHPTSSFMGQAIERMRLRWYYHQDEEIQTERSLIGLNEMEIVEHSVRQWKVISKVQGVGTQTVNSYYDFLTGEPMVSVVSGLKAGDEPDPALPTKTTVTVPAHWIGEYNPGPSGTQASMGSIFDDRNFFGFSTGEKIPGRTSDAQITHRNMLTQTFSQSLYSGLPDYQSGCTQPCTPWRDGLAGTSILNRNVNSWKLFTQSQGNRPAWRMDESFNLKLPMADNPRRVIVDRGSIGLPMTLAGETVAARFRQDPAYVLTSQTTQYGDLGEALETRDAYDSRVTSFYQGHKLLVGQVLNSDRSSCALLTMDELSAPSSLAPVWEATGATLVSDVGRSGEKSLRFDVVGQRLKLTLPQVTKGRTYEFSVWAKDPAQKGFLTLRVNGVQARILPITYVPGGPEWQRTLVQLPVSSSTTGPVQVVAEVELEAGPSGSMWLDDARFVPEDAQAHTMTYDVRGNRSSEAGPNDVLVRYQYDAFGRLAEVQDHQGVLVSTQAELEAK